MDKQQIKQSILKEIQSNDFKDTVESVSLFGSYLSGTATKNSDIDILIDFHPQATVGFFKLSQIKRTLEKSLNKEVDLVTPESLSPYFREEIINNSEKIYEQQ